MKAVIATLFLFFVLSHCRAQGIFFPYPENGDSAIFFEQGSLFTEASIILDSAVHNKWQIGRPEKIVFDTAFEGSRAIVTDTADIITSGDTSIFYVKLKNSSDHYMTSILDGIGFIHKLNADSGSIANVEQLLVDRATHMDSIWVSVVNKPFYNDQWKYCDTPSLKNNTNGWDTVIVYLHDFYDNMYNAGYWSYFPGDTSLFRFTYISNDTSLTKDGWMIDGIWATYTAYGDRVNTVTSTEFKIYPNPSNGNFYIEEKKPGSVKAVSITDVIGKVVYTADKLPSDGQLHMDLPNGLYTLRCFSTQGVSAKQLLIQH